MNFEESNEFVEQMEKNNKNKKTVLTVLAICAILIVVLFVLIGYIRNKDNEKLKMFVDEKQVAISSTLLMQTEDGSYYMNVKELANMLGYSYQKGEYKNYTEDAESCYLRTPYEIISMQANSDVITKYILSDKITSTSNTNKNNATSEQTSGSKDLIILDEQTKEQTLNIVVDSENETEEIFSIEDSIQYINNELYVPFTQLAKIFSVQLNVSQHNSNLNRIRINSIANLAPQLYQIATSQGYTEVSNIYENLTAVADGMLVVGDGTRYGVMSLEDGHEIISLKYDKIVYKQNNEEFFVTAENSIGIINKEGSTIIKPTEYDSIASLDETTKLYLVEKNHQYGVINRQGNTIVYAEYDSIGLENKEEFSNEDIRNFSLLFDKCIPVNRNGKVGIIDIEGNEKLKCVYNSLGYVKSNTTNIGDKNSNSSTNKNDTTNEVSNNTTKNNTIIEDDYEGVLTIPESTGIKGIVVELNNLYGVYDAEAGRLIIPCACSRVYSKRKSGVLKYYLEYNEQEIELEGYLESNGLKSVTKKISQEKESELEQVSENENTTDIEEMEE